MSALDVNVQEESTNQELQDAEENQARREGWKPKEEFEGDESDWVDAATFNKRGREINPILKKNNQRLQTEIDGLRRELREAGESIKSLQKYNSEIQKKAYERAVKQVKSELRAARRDGNNDLVDDLEDQLEDLRSQEPEEPAADPTPSKPEVKDPTQDPVFREWMSANPWFSDSNPDMLDHANAVGMRLRRTNPSLVGQAFLEEITKAVKKAFPEKFGGKRTSPSMVIGDASPTGSHNSGAAKSIRELPADAQSSFKEYSKEKWYIDLAKSKGLTPEQMFVQDYEE